MSSSRADVVKLPLPSGVKAGLLVGRGGNNSRWLHWNSGGAHFTINDTAISIRAKDYEVRARALQLVRRQLDAMVKFGECLAGSGGGVQKAKVRSLLGMIPITSNPFGTFVCTEGPCMPRRAHE
jgi:hypothetical protein